MAPWFVALVVAGALAPRIVYFKGRLRGRALAIHTASNAMVMFGMRQWLAPWGRRHTARLDAAREQLAGELGREPTEAEILTHLGFTTD